MNALIMLLIGLIATLAYANVPTYVMMPLTTVSFNVCKNVNELTNYNWVRGKFQGLKSIGARGVMSDCWWGLVEKKGPRVYDFTAYRQMADLAREAGIKIQMVLSFHACGGNVGDDCDIPIPQWLENPVYYKSKSGGETQEVISLFADNQPMDALGRTPLQMYKEFMAAFQDQIVQEYPDVITEVQVGAGSTGELRYPAYQLQDNRWSYCGVGEFQSYDFKALESVKQAAAAVGHPEWGMGGGPGNAGSYNCRPYGWNNNQQDCSFFTDGFDSYYSDYGKFFLKWYSDSLVKHGEELTIRAREVFGQELTLSMKIAGIHWGYDSYSHGAEITAGYYNTNFNDAYGQIADMLERQNFIFCFTCLEMANPNDGQCASKPVSLVGQTMNAVDRTAGRTGKRKADLYAGENALPIHNYESLDRIINWSKDTHSFTFLRLTDSTNWDHLKYLINGLGRA